MSEGQLQLNPLAELIREIANAELSGALRLARDRAKAVVYFENGEVVSAASNLRPHRLIEIVRRSHLVKDEQLAAATATDNEVADFLLQRGGLSAESLKAIRTSQVADVLRSALLWTEGSWQFDPRVRVAADTRVAVDLKRLLLECARHLPESYVASRFADADERIEATKANGYEAALLPPEAFVLSRVSPTVTLAELQMISGVSESETLRAVYGLSLCDLLNRSNWPTPAIKADCSVAPKKSKASPESIPETPVGEAIGSPINEEAELQALFARLEKTTDYYDILGIDRQATLEQVKSTYHALARRYHPDRFHQSDVKLRTRVDSAFARIARAYETLSDETLRGAYDGQYTSRLSESTAARTNRDGTNVTENKRAASSFQTGLAALRSKKLEEAIRWFAEAASLEPRIASYRAQYGHALAGQAQTRRTAELELKAAIALDPRNASYRLMLAELYKTVGLYRRAESEAQRALSADPKSEAARLFLAEFKS